MRAFRIHRARSRQKPLGPITIARHAAGETNYDSIPQSVHGTLETPGQPLESTTRTFMESRFGQDFSHVRVHADARADGSARDIGARAYAAGNHIAFQSNEYAPATNSGRHLIAHELAHVVQNDRGELDGSAPISRPGDASEVAADRAAASVVRGESTAIERGSRAAISRQLAGPLAPKAPPMPSQGEAVLREFLNAMWIAQSDQQEDFRITAGVLEGLNYIFKLGVGVSKDQIYKSLDEVIARLRSTIPEDVDTNVIKVLDRLPGKERKLSARQKPSGDPAAMPKSPVPGGPPQLPQPPKGYSDAAAAALGEAFRRFSQTELGKELEKSVKKYAFSVEGIPLDIVVLGGIVTFVAKDDPSLPSSPDIPLAEGIKIKIDISGKASQLGPLIEDLISHGRSEHPPQAGQGEAKVGVTFTFTNEGIATAAKAIGHFFAEAGKWIAKGVVKAGTVIGKAAKSIWRELAFAAGGAALGAAIGGIAGGGIGAAIGAGVGALVGLGAGLLSHFAENRHKKKDAKKEPPKKENAGEEKTAEKKDA
jgi:hypothetical protein